MNDYKELIELLAHPADGRDNADIMISAADAIEQLVKERDAVVADIQPDCGYCKWLRDFGDGAWCFCPSPCRDISGVKTMWEWRGVREASE